MPDFIILFIVFSFIVFGYRILRTIIFFVVYSECLNIFPTFSKLYWMPITIKKRNINEALGKDIGGEFEEMLLDYFLKIKSNPFNTYKIFKNIQVIKYEINDLKAMDHSVEIDDDIILVGTHNGVNIEYSLYYQNSIKNSFYKTKTLFTGKEKMTLKNM